MQAREARERGETLEDMAALHVAFLLLAQTQAQVTVQAGIGGVEPGIRNFKPVPLLLEKIQGLCSAALLRGTRET